MALLYRALPSCTQVGVRAVDVMEEVVSEGEEAAQLQDSGSQRRKKQRGDKRKR